MRVVDFLRRFPGMGTEVDWLVFEDTDLDMDTDVFWTLERDYCFLLEWVYLTGGVLLRDHFLYLFGDSHETRMRWEFLLDVGILECLPVYGSGHMASELTPLGKRFVCPGKDQWIEPVKTARMLQASLCKMLYSLSHNYVVVNPGHVDLFQGSDLDGWFSYEDEIRATLERVADLQMFLRPAWQGFPRGDDGMPRYRDTVRVKPEFPVKPVRPVFVVTGIQQPVEWVQCMLGLERTVLDGKADFLVLVDRDEDVRVAKESAVLMSGTHIGEYVQADLMEAMVSGADIVNLDVGQYLQ